MSFNPTNLLNVITIRCPVKFVEKFAGADLTTFGGIISFGPPCIGTTTAQATISKDMATNAIHANSMGIRRSAGFIKRFAIIAAKMGKIIVRLVENTGN